jgi:hypothetical protein
VPEGELLGGAGQEKKIDPQMIMLGGGVMEDQAFLRENRKHAVGGGHMEGGLPGELGKGGPRIVMAGDRPDQGNGPMETLRSGAVFGPRRTAFPFFFLAAGHRFSGKKEISGKTIAFSLRSVNLKNIIIQ